MELLIIDWQSFMKGVFVGVATMWVIGMVYMIVNGKG